LGNFGMFAGGGVLDRHGLGKADSDENPSQDVIVLIREEIRIKG